MRLPFTRPAPLFVAAALVFARVAPVAAEPLTLEKSIPLPDVEGRFDHASADPATHRLFFAALGNNTLEVIDISAGKRLHTIKGLDKPTGVVFVENLNAIVVANGAD